ncbi:MAG: M4 family metallopeptidase [Bacteroidales bacterium]|nr:M4 family metallopeptidase [Bacteroidales bacterium]
MSTKHLLLAFMVLTFALSGKSQVRFQQRDTAANGTITFARFRTDSTPIPMSNSTRVLREIHRMRPNDEWRLTGSARDEMGYNHQYFQQYYKGVRVAYGTYGIHTSKNNSIETVLGNFQPVGEVNTTPTLTEPVALEYALKYINAKIYKWQIPEEEKWVKDNFNKTYYPKGELVIIKDRLKTDKKYRLAYKFDIYAHKPLSRDYIYVDALTGEVIDKDSRIHQANSSGIAQTRYSGARNITTDSYSGGYRLRETRNGVRIETYNMNRADRYTQTDFTDNDNNWTATEFNNPNMDNAALDAHWGAEMVYDYFKQVHKRNSYNGNGGSLFGYVHGDLVALGYKDNDNAFWDGQRMTYGDGAFLFTPLTCLDVCAHEIAHGICETTARLRYLGESGAIDEGLSDIWGACVENWATTNKQTWLIGNEISFFGTPMRNMANPNAGLSPQPDTYNGYYWVDPSSSADNGGVHTNSGVVNYWFYLVSQGGSGTNNLENAYSVNAIGINRAASIVYYTERWKIKSDVEQVISFNQFREATIQTAIDSFGVNSCEVIAVTNAWYAVGVGAKFQYTNVNVAGPTLVCSSGSAFTVNNLPSGCSVSWNASSNLYSQSPTGGSTTYKAIGNGLGQVQATLSSTCASTTLSPFYVTVGSPVPGTIAIAFDVPPGRITAAISPVSSATSYRWYLDGTLMYSNSRTSAVFPRQDNCDHIYYIDVAEVNACGVSGISHGEVSEDPCYYGFTISPNPASDNITLTIGSADNTFSMGHSSTGTSALASKYISTKAYTIRVLDSFGALKATLNKSGETVTLPVGNLNNGVYVVEINDGKNVYRQQLVVKH